MPQEKANLARIRDNQRRSRARRKEYLQELEAKLRQCELQGVEASSEIQIAARKVAEENKKLRTLLVQNGVPNKSIEQYVQSPLPSDTAFETLHGIESSAVQALEQLLLTRKSCRIDGNTSWNQASRGRSRGSSVGTVPSGCDSNDDCPASALTQQPIEILSPSHTSNINMTHTSYEAPPYHNSTSVPNMNIISPTGASNMFQYDGQFNFDDTSYTQLPFQHPISSYSTTTASNANSCVLATDMITGMAGADPSAVRADLGCQPGLDCQVDNHLVFNVMDRYSGSGI